MEKQKGLAIITGASQGIGAVIAAGLATDGYRVVLIARSKQNLLYYHWTLQIVQRQILKSKTSIKNMVLSISW